MATTVILSFVVDYIFANQPSQDQVWQTSFSELFAPSGVVVFKRKRRPWSVDSR
jgi:hypothetical protein